MPAALSVWNTSTARPLTITYKFATAAPTDMWVGFAGWTPFTAAQKNVIRAALAEIESVINVHFVATTAANPTIEFGRVALRSSEGGQGGYRYAYTTQNGHITSKTLDGFAVFNKVAALTSHMVLHEIGHALTLKHPGNYAAGTPGPYLPTALDNNKYSVMSYNPDPDNGALNPHLGIYDIAALQARFGANLHYRIGNDTCTGPIGLMQAIWDAGGNDTISGAGRTTAVTINLNDGTFSSLGAKDNLAIALGVIIENAVGGSGDDTIVGNQWNNALFGGDGDDRIMAGAGNDRLVGGAGNDALTGDAGADTFVFNTELDATRN